MMHPMFKFLGSFIWVLPALGQVHLLTGSPFSLGQASYPSALLRIDDNGGVQRIAQIVRPSLGTEWIGVSYDWGLAVLRAWEEAVVVIDFEKGAVTKQCRPPGSDGRTYIASWLAEAPGAGPSYQWKEVGADVTRDIVVKSMVLNAAVPCERSFSTVDQESIRYAVAHGEPGIADVVNSDGVRIITTEEGTVISGIAQNRAPLGYTVPLALLRGFETLGESMVINDSHVFVLRMGDAHGNVRVLLFRKSDQTWHTFPRPADDIRGFGRYIATAEALQTPDSRKAPSAGMQKWKPGRDGVRPDLRERIAALNQHHPLSYPGRLHVYDIDTGQLYTINTGQGDSEVLLIESGVVYYRAADELYSAVIGPDGIGRSRLLATDDSIRDAHWAFIKH